MTKGRLNKNTNKEAKKAKKKTEAELKKYEGVRLFVAVPSTDMVHADFAMSLAALANHNTSVNIRMALNNTKGSDIARTRNAQVYQARKLKATHILFIDSDMVFKPWTAQRLLDLMIDQKESIIGTTVPKRIYPYYQFCKDVDGNRFKIQPDDMRGLVECKELGTGLVLIDLKVFNEIPFPWFDTYYKTNEEGEPDIEQAVSEDLSFFFKAAKEGFRPMCDIALSMDTKHIGSVQFDYTSEDFFADAIELRRQKAEELLNQRLKANAEEKGEEVGEIGSVPVEAVGS